MSAMDDRKSEFLWVVKAARVALIVTLAMTAIGTAGCVAMIVIKAGDISRAGGWDPVILYFIGLLGCPVLVVWTLVMYGLVQAAASNEAAANSADGRLGRMETLLADHGHSLSRLINLESLSDRAKSLIYRDRELEAMAEVIHEDMLRQDYDAAAALIETMEQQFGCADQAAALGDELAQARKATIEEKLDSAVVRVQRIIESHDWQRASRAADKIRSLFPNHPTAASLPQRVEEERAKHKRQLLEDYGEAVRKDDVNRGIDLLKELDRYLTPQEAAAMAESARGVFRAKLHNLGVQFAIHVTDQRWAEAVATGEEIMRGFPNSRMSHEVRQKMPQLRELMDEARSAAEA